MNPASQRKTWWMTELLIALLIVSGIGTLYAQDPSDLPKGPGPQLATPPTGARLTPTPFEPPEHVFNRLDANRTGYLTREQLGTLERFPFDQADLDRDGRLSPAEFSRAWGAWTTNR